MTEKNQIYNAFVEAGLEREARQLSTTKNGKVVPAIGHYIVIADNALGNDNFSYSQNSMDAISEIAEKGKIDNSHSKLLFLIDARKLIGDYVTKLTRPSPNDKNFPLLMEKLNKLKSDITYFFLQKQ